MNKKTVIFGIAIAYAVTLSIFVGALYLEQAKNSKENRQKSRTEKIVSEYMDIDYQIYIAMYENFKKKNYKEALNYSKMSNSIRKAFYKSKNINVKDTEDFICLSKLVDLNEKIKKNPKDYKLYYERAKLQDVPEFSPFEEGKPPSFCSDYKAATEDYSKVLELNPKLAEVYEKRGDARGHSFDGMTYDSSKKEEMDKFFNDEMSKTIQDYQKAIELNAVSNSHPTLKVKLAGSYLSIKQYDTALELSQKLLPTHPEAYYIMAIAYYKTKQYEKAVEYVNLFLERGDEVCSRRPTCDYRYIYRLRLEANLRQFKLIKALKDFKKSFAAEPIKTISGL